MTFQECRELIAAHIQANWTLTDIEWPNQAALSEATDYVSIRIDDVSPVRIGYGAKNRTFSGNLIARFYTKPGTGTQALLERAQAMDNILAGSTLQRLQFLDSQTNEDGVGSQRNLAVLLYVVPFVSTEPEA